MIRFRKHHGEDYTSVATVVVRGETTPTLIIQFNFNNDG
jgi:hypothetical protein